MGKENDSLDINEKIQLLDDELTNLYILKDEFMDVKSEIYNVHNEYGDYWKGMNANMVYECCGIKGQLGGLIFLFEDSIDTICREVENKRDCYANERHENKFFYGIED